MGIKAKTYLGQHFLHDQGTLNVMVKAGEIKPTDTVVEIGAGNGVLTKALLATGANILAYEIDKDCFATLRELAENHPQLTVIERSILDSTAPEGEYKVIANIPYYLTGTILRLFMHVFDHQPERMILLVQKEVAQKITATDSSILSLAVQIYGEAKIIRQVSKGAFNPPPQVDSAVIQIIAHPRPILEVSSTDFFKLARACYHNQRKQIQVSLRNVVNLSRDQVIDMLQTLQIDPTLRPEKLSLSQWQALVKQFQPYMT